MDTTYRPMSIGQETLCMDDTWAILARTISQYTVHGAPKFMIFWSISLTQYAMDTSERKRCGGRERGAPTRD
jgi:hypothetical protein